MATMKCETDNMKCETDNMKCEMDNMKCETDNMKSETDKLKNKSEIIYWINKENYNFIFIPEIESAVFYFDENQLYTYY